MADSRWLFLSSANLTEYAFTVNMELGVLITGGPLPRQVEEHLEKMIQTGVLERLDADVGLLDRKLRPVEPIAVQ